MAIGTPASLGTNFIAGTTAVVITLTVAASVAVGDDIFVFVGCDETKTVTSVTDDAGNTYEIDKQSNSSGAAAIAHARCTNALTSGVSVITANYSSGVVNTDKTIAACSVSGLPLSSAVDVFSAKSGTTTTWNNSSVTPRSAEQIAFGLSVNARTIGASTPDSPWVELFDFNTGGDSTMTVVYQKLAAIAAQNPSGTWTGGAAGDPWNSVICTYRANAPILPDYKRFPKPKLRR